MTRTSAARSPAGKRQFYFSFRSLSWWATYHFVLLLCIDLYKDGVPPRRSGTGIVMVLVVSQRGGLGCGGGGGDLSFFTMLAHERWRYVIGLSSGREGNVVTWRDLATWCMHG